MRALGLLSVTLPADDPAAVQQWWQDTLGLGADADDPAALALGDLELRFGVPALRVVAPDVDAPQRLVDPAGTAVEVVGLDLEAGRRAEEALRDFRTEADRLGGPPVEALADDVAAIVLEARDRIATLLAGVPHNKVLATQFALSQRARDLSASEEQWPLHAASTLMSGFVIPGATGG